MSAHVNSPEIEIQELEDRYGALGARIPAFKSGNDKRYPIELIEKLSEGAIPVGVWRASHRLTMADLPWPLG